MESRSLMARPPAIRALIKSSEADSKPVTDGRLKSPKLVTEDPPALDLPLSEVGMGRK
jgi:hypothetical protein